VKRRVKCGGRKSRRVSCNCWVSDDGKLWQFNSPVDTVSMDACQTMPNHWKKHKNSLMKCRSLSCTEINWKTGRKLREALILRFEGCGLGNCISIDSQELSPSNWANLRLLKAFFYSFKCLHIFLTHCNSFSLLIFTPSVFFPLFFNQSALSLWSWAA